MNTEDMNMEPAGFIPIVRSFEFGEDAHGVKDTADQAIKALARIKKKADKLDDGVERTYLIEVLFQ